MSLLRALRILLALALLSAQHAALSHAIWHLDDHGLPLSEQNLCQQHAALDTVAGAVNSAQPVLPALQPVADCPRSVPRPVVTAPGLEPSSRGPPSLL